MKASTLKNRVAKSQNANGTAPKNRDYQFAIEVIFKGMCRNGYYTGSGRFTKSSVARPEYYLTAWGIDFETGNDAPRGGVTGIFVKLTKKGQKQVKAYVAEINEENARIYAEQQAEELIQKQENENRIKEAYENIQNCDFFQLWNNGELKNVSGKSWSGYRNDLKIANPQGWAELKEKFRANAK